MSKDLRVNTPMEESIKVSVVMATYNRYDTLPRVIDSILAQTLKSLEFIIIDDGSRDNTPKLLQEYARKDSRIKVITQKNQGLASSRNNGVKQAKGKYIAFVDSDDACAINRLELQVDFLEKNKDVHAVACECTDINKFNPGIAGSAGTKVMWNTKGVYKADGIKGSLGPSTVISKESFLRIGGYRKHPVIIEDIDFTLRYGEKNKWSFMAGASLYFYEHPLAQKSTGLSNMDPIKFLQRHIACYISAWYNHNNLVDPVADELDLEDILKLTQSLPFRVKYLIFKSTGHLFATIVASQKLTLNQSKSYILDLLGYSVILKYSILLWSNIKLIIKHCLAPLIRR